jgi:hypothetical protein
MSKDERIVREAWERVDYFEPYDGPGNCLVVIGRVSDETLQRFEGKTKVEAWHAAAEFTTARREELRLINQQLQFLEISLSEVEHGSWDVSYVPVVESIITERKTALVDLQRGMKETK